MLLALFCPILCRTLHVTRHSGYAGSALLFHPFESREQFEMFDMQFRTACCEIDGFTDFCDLFFDQRLINTGGGYEPPRLGKGR